MPGVERFVIPVIMGSVQQLQSVSFGPGTQASITLVARRSLQRPGTRHWRRGADAEASRCLHRNAGNPWRNNPIQQANWQIPGVLQRLQWTLTCVFNLRNRTLDRLGRVESPVQSQGNRFGKGLLLCNRGQQVFPEGGGEKCCSFLSEL